MKLIFTPSGIFTCIVLLFYSLQTNGQAWTDAQQDPLSDATKPQRNFYDMQKSFNDYWKDKIGPEKNQIPKGKGYKQFKRWEWFWEQRVGKSGEFPKSSIVMEEWEKYLAEHPEAKESLQRQQQSGKSLSPGDDFITNASSNGNWRAMGPSSSNSGYSGVGRLNNVAFHPSDPNIFWVGSPSGGLWKTTNGGISWSTQTDNLPVLGVSGIIINPGNPNIMYIATGDAFHVSTYSVGVLKSTNGGASWTPTGLSYAVSAGVQVRALVMHPTNYSILLAATSNGIYRTTNAGTSWTLEQAGNFQEVKFNPTTPSIAYASSVGYSAQIYRTVNTGDTWTQETTFSGINRIALAVTPANPALVGALLSYSSNSGFAGYYRSLDNGDTYNAVYLPGANLLGWSETGNDVGGQSWYDLCLAISPTNQNIIHAGGVNTWWSTNGGFNWGINTTWTGNSVGVQVVHADKHFMAYQPGTNTLFQCNDGGLYKTTNGFSWTDLSNGLQITQFYRIGNSVTNANLTLAGAQDNGTKRRNNFTWTDVIGADGMECIIDYSNTNIMYGTTQNGGLYKSTNGGTNFFYNGNGFPGGAWVTPYIIDPANPQILYAGSTNVYKTTNGGTNWFAISSNLTGGSYLQSLAVAPSNTQTIYAATSYAMYKTTNGGTNWSTVTLPSYYQAVTSIKVSSYNPEVLWITYSGYGAGIKVYRSDNGGASWTNISGTLPNLPVNTLEQDKNTGTLYVGTDVGVFVRNSSMADWQTYDAGLPNVVVNELEIQYSSGRLRAATYGRGLWESDLFNGQLQASAYCAPFMSTGCTSDDVINNFSFNTLLNNSSGCNGQPNGYNTYYPSGTLTTTVQNGLSYTISMQAGTVGQGFGVWIDYNDDKDFDDLGEFVYASPTAGIGVYSGTVTIPANASTGLRRMRVRSRWNATFTASQSCTAYTWGETEDYTISIGYCVPAVSVLCTSEDFIKNFSFNTLTNNNSNCNNQQFNYINYTPSGSRTTTLTKGQSYPISLQSGPIGQSFGVWIDYNNDYDFNDANEFVYSSPTAGTGVYNGTVTIPAGASSGQKRMRVRARWSTLFTSGQWCDAVTWGETEDYTITVSDPVVASSQWNKRFGGSNTDLLSITIRTTDGGYLLGGHSLSGLSGDRSQDSRGAQDYWIVKISSTGTKQWDKRFGGSGADYLNSIIQTSDGGYLLGGNSLSGVSGDRTQASQGGRDYWIVKITSTGIKQWDRRFGGSADEDLKAVHQLSTGEYYLSGFSLSGLSGDKTQSGRGGQDFWVLKLTSTGTKIWDRRFGGSLDDYLDAAIVTSDGGLLAGGGSASGLSGDRTQASQGGRDYWVVKISGTGTKQWDKRFGGSLDDNLQALTRTSDGNYLIGGISASGLSGDRTQASQGGNDFWVVKISGTGAKLWDKRFGSSVIDELRALIQTSDGGYLLGGRSNSPVGGNKSQPSQGGHDFWVVKTDAAGIKQWDKRFGGSADEVLRSLIQTTEGGYLLAGYSTSGISGDKTQASQGGTDFWIVKLSGSGGAIAPPIAARVASEEDAGTADKSLLLNASPNPFSEKITIGFTLQQTELVKLKIYNSQGLEVNTLFEGEAEKDKAYEFEWSGRDQKAGMYIIRLGTETQSTHKKIVLTR